MGLGYPKWPELNNEYILYRYVPATQEDVPISRDTSYNTELKRRMIKNLESNKLQNVTQLAPLISTGRMIKTKYFFVVYVSRLKIVCEIQGAPKNVEHGDF